MTPAGGFGRDDLQDQSGNERLGFLIPMRLTRQAGLVKYESVGKGAGVIGDIDSIGIERVEGIEGRRGEAGNAEGVQDMDRAELLAGTAGDLRILALGIDADDGTVGGEQVRNDRSHALAGSRRRHGQQMGWTIVAQ